MKSILCHFGGKKRWTAFRDDTKLLMLILTLALVHTTFKNTEPNLNYNYNKVTAINSRFNIKFGPVEELMLAISVFIKKSMLELLCDAVCGLRETNS